MASVYDFLSPVVVNCVARREFVRKYEVDLTDSERKTLSLLLDTGNLSQRKRQRCKVLLLAAEGKLVQDIIDELGVGAALVHRVRKRYVLDGLEKAVHGLPIGNPKKHQVDLTGDERNILNEMIEEGELSERELRRCKILILSDDGRLDVEICEQLNIHLSSVTNTRKRYIAKGLDIAIKGLPILGSKHMFTEEQCLEVKDLAMSPPPQGEGRWTLKLLAEKLVSGGMVERVSLDTIRRSLMRVGLEKLP